MGPSWHLLSTILGASCDRWSVYLATSVLVICSPFEVIWALLGAHSWHLLGTFLGSRGLVWAPLGAISAALGNSWSPGAAKEANGHENSGS